MALFGRGRVDDPAALSRAMAQAAELVGTGQVDKARRQYQRIAQQLAEDPATPDPERGLALLGQAETTQALGNEAEALGVYREALPHLADPARQVSRGVLRSLSDERIRRAAANAGPANPDLRDFLGVVAFLQVTAWSPEAGPETESVQRALSWLQEQCRTGADERREAVALAAVEALPGQDWPVLARTELLRGQGRVEEAEALLAVSAPGGSSELWFAWGGVLSTLRRYDQAVVAFDEALRRGSGVPSPWSRGPALRGETLLFRGLAEQQLGNLKEAAEDLAEAATQMPRDARPQYALGRLALQQDQDEKAREHFTAALKTRLDYTPARLAIAVLNERAGRHSEAAAHYRAALAQQPDSLPAKVRLGACLSAAGKRDEAEQLLREVAGPSFWGQVASFHLGLSRLRSGDASGALRVCARLSSLR